MLTPAAHAYLAAFDAYLKAPIADRDDEFVAVSKHEALRDLVGARVDNPDEFLSRASMDPRGPQTSPRVNGKKKRRSRWFS